jgi:hypothetical protein
MILLLLYLIIFIIYIHIFYFFIFIIGTITNKYTQILYFFKNKLTHSLSHVVRFNKKIYIKKNYNLQFSNKVDIVISNHYNISDWTMNGSLLYQFDNKNINYILKNKHIFFGATGCIMDDTNDIYIHKDFKIDQHLIREGLYKLNNGLILIYLEGGQIWDIDKYEKSIKYCKENNIKPFKNILSPKITGIWFMINELKKQNKLGNLIDLTTKRKYKHPLYHKPVESHNHFNLSNILQKGDYYCNIQTYNLDKYDNLDDFRTFIFNLWRDKDKVINDKNYKILEFKNNYISNILLFFIVMITYAYLIKKTDGIIIFLTILIIYIKNRKVFNKIKSTEPNQ